MSVLFLILLCSPASSQNSRPTQDERYAVAFPSVAPLNTDIFIAAGDGSDATRGQPTTLVRDVGSAAAYSAATRDHSRIVIRVSPDAAKDKGEIRVLFGWQDALRQRNP